MRWIVALWLCVGVAHAQPTSPGPLGASHAQVACDGCHVDRTAAVSNAQCASCHQALVQRGLHVAPSIIGKECWSCHRDHRGTGFDLQGWHALKGGIQAFDHEALAKWRLGGAHARTACVDCHTGKMASGRTRFTGLSTTCGASGCHQANPHRFAGPDFLRCDRCHSESVWKPAKQVLDFDHAHTKLPLVGAHRDVPCIQCHPKTAFALTKPECAACHVSPKHASPRFDKLPCEPCHSAAAKTFAVVTFDHDERTKFKLDAGHRIACVKCHTAKLGLAKPSPACEACHPNKTPHGKRFDKVQGGCASCHNAVRWTSSPAFSHGTHTKFALVGKHGVTPCRACHRATGPGNFEKLATAGCKECHAHATVHADAGHPQGKYTTKQCTGCHVNNMHDPPPRPNIFHGPQSVFPLVKGHKAVPCVDCHVERTTKGRIAFGELSMECGDKCHEDSAHRGALGAKCTACHVSGQWEALKFEHLAYPLEGDHRDAACATCHGASKVFKGAPRRCADAACHARDDAHAGALGTTCDRCHLANGDNRFNHTISAKFKLDGKHTGVACADCHPSRSFKPRPFNCSGCHPEPRAHFGKYGTFCERCHTTNGWR